MILMRYIGVHDLRAQMVGDATCLQLRLDAQHPHARSKNADLSVGRRASEAQQERKLSGKQWTTLDGQHSTAESTELTGEALP